MALTEPSGMLKGARLGVVLERSCESVPAAVADVWQFKLTFAVSPHTPLSRRANRSILVLTRASPQTTVLISAIRCVAGPSRTGSSRSVYECAPSPPKTRAERSPSKAMAVSLLTDQTISSIVPGLRPVKYLRASQIIVNYQGAANKCQG